MTVHTPPVEDSIGDLERREALRRILRQGEIVLDVGANRGQFAMDVIGIQDVTIHCFEPAPEAFRDLQEVAIGEARIIPHNLAVSDSNGAAQFWVQKSDVGSSLLEPVDNQTSDWLTPNNKITVETLRLDSFMTNMEISKVALLKSDAQGFDQRVIASSGSFLTPESIGAVLVEMNFHTFYVEQDSTSSLIRLMETSGYFVAGIFRHYNRAGWLWWADVLFLPNIAPFSTNLD